MRVSASGSASTPALSHSAQPGPAKGAHPKAAGRSPPRSTNRTCLFGRAQARAQIAAETVVPEPPLTPQNATSMAATSLRPRRWERAESAQEEVGPGQPSDNPRPSDQPGGDLTLSRTRQRGRNEQTSRTFLAANTSRTITISSSTTFFMTRILRLQSRVRIKKICGGGGRESNPPDGDRPSHPL